MHLEVRADDLSVIQAVNLLPALHGLVRQLHAGRAAAAAADPSALAETWRGFAPGLKGAGSTVGSPSADAPAPVSTSDRNSAASAEASVSSSTTARRCRGESRPTSATRRRCRARCSSCCTR